MSDKLARWKELLRISDSREHRGPGAGGCFKAYGERGCPCCDAYDDLASDVGEMISEVERMEETARGSLHRWGFEEADTCVDPIFAMAVLAINPKEYFRLRDIIVEHHEASVEYNSLLSGDETISQQKLKAVAERNLDARAALRKAAKEFAVPQAEAKKCAGCGVVLTGADHLGGKVYCPTCVAGLVNTVPQRSSQGDRHG